MSIKVLLIDDDVDTTTVYKNSLTLQQFEVFIANSGAEGIKLAHEVHPDVIVVDLMMPQMTGWEVCRIIRSFSQVPILVSSAVVEAEGVMKALEAGATDYLVKPIPLGTLASHIRLAVRQ